VVVGLLELVGLEASSRTWLEPAPGRRGGGGGQRRRTALQRPPRRWPRL